MIPFYRYSTPPSHHVHLVHLANELIDELLPVAEIATLDKVFKLPRTETTGRIREFEGPEEVGGLLEVGPDSENLVDEILNTKDAELAELLLDDVVVGYGQALLIDLAVAALVNELADSLEVWVAVGDEGFDDLEHLKGGLGQADKDAIVDLKKTEQLERLAFLGVDLVDTDTISIRPFAPTSIRTL